MKSNVVFRAVAFCVLAAIVLSLPVFAQGGMPPGPPGGLGGPVGPGGGMHGPGPGFFGAPGPHHGKLVTNAPYSATLSNTVVQHLADGNTVTRSTAGQVARDSQGRTYEQVTITGGPFAGTAGSKTLTFISDPVTGYAYVLDSTKKTAIQRLFHPRTDDAAMQNKPSRPQRPNTAEADLPADSSSGVSADGKSITRTIPANTMGNAQPIVTTDQVWYSADLQIVVKSVRKDPFFGESTYALTNVVSKEPDASLFKVPTGFTVTAASAAHERHRMGGPPVE